MAKLRAGVSRALPPRAVLVVFTARANFMEIFTIPATVAFEWLQGKSGETEIRAARDAAADVVFIMDLENLAAYRPFLKACCEFARRGSVAMVARTKNPVVKHHMEKWGAKSLLTETFESGETHHRILLMPDDFKRWTGKLAAQPKAPCHPASHLKNTAPIES